MKNFFSILSGVLAFVVCVVVSLLVNHPEGIALASFVPIMPAVMGRRLVNRAVKFADGTFGQGVQWIHDILFDRFRLLAANPLTTTLFRNKPGDQRNGVVLTIVDTNIVSNQVPVQQKWYLWKLSAKYQAAAIRSDANIQSILDFMRTTLIEFKIENLDRMFIFPLSKFLPFDQLVSNPAVTVNSQYPKSSEDCRWEMKIPLVLEQNAVWGLNVIQTAASAAGLDNDFILFLFERELYRGE